jgi:hypothetical protein
VARKFEAAREREPEPPAVHRAHPQSANSARSQPALAPRPAPVHDPVRRGRRLVGLHCLPADRRGREPWTGGHAPGRDRRGGRVRGHLRVAGADLLRRAASAAAVRARDDPGARCRRADPHRPPGVGLLVHLLRCLRGPGGAADDDVCGRARLYGGRGGRLGAGRCARHGPGGRGKHPRRRAADGLDA